MVFWYQRFHRAWTFI